MPRSAPPTQFFTSTVGETLTGADGQDTTFVGLVDRGIIEQSMLSNIVDIAQGGTGATNTLAITVLHNVQFDPKPI